MGGDIPVGALFFLISVLLLLSAFFSGSETALMSLNRYKLRHKASKGNRSAQITEKLLQKPDRLIGLILLGNNAVIILASSLVGILSVQLGGEIGFAIGTAILTFVVLIFVETAPKTLAALEPEKVALPSAYIYFILLKILYPLVWLTNILANGVLRLLGLKNTNTDSYALNREELRTVVYEAGARISGKYRQMLLSILDLGQVSVDDVMVPHNEIIGINIDNHITEITKILRNSNHTRLPVFKDNIDNVLGILHLRKLANIFSESKLTVEKIQTLLEDPYFVPEGTPLSTQLRQFQKSRRRFALVVDEYGDIQGIVTLQDILEEIVGEFTDEQENESDIIKESETSWIVNGMANVREMNKLMNWEFSTSGPKTFNGLVVEYLETIPEPGTNLQINNHLIEIIETRGNRVQLARIYKEEKNLS